MELDKKKDIIDKYNSTSYFYDKRYSNIQLEKYKLALNDQSFSNKVIFDAGCGTGLLWELARVLEGKHQDATYHFVGSDISWEMLNVFLLKTKNQEICIKRAIHLVLSDMEKLPFRDESFEAFFSFTSLQNLHDMKQGVKECLRTSGTGTRVIFSILKKKKGFNDLLTLFKTKMNDLEILDNHNLEDAIVRFYL